MRSLPSLPAILAALAALCGAQTQEPDSKPAPVKLVKSWMDLPVGTEVRYAGLETTKVTEAKGGFMSMSLVGGQGILSWDDVRVFVLSQEADGTLELGVLHESGLKAAPDHANVNSGIVHLDPRTGTIVELADSEGTSVSDAPSLGTLAKFAVGDLPFPPLSPDEMRAKKPLQKTVHTIVMGDPLRLDLAVKFGKAKDSKKGLMTSIVCEPPTAAAIPVKLTSIVPMLQMAGGSFPTGIGAEIEPADALLTAMRVEYLVDPANGHVIAVKRDWKITADAGSFKEEGSGEMRELKRRLLTGAAAKSMRETVLEIEEIRKLTFRDRPAALTRATALKAKAAKLDMVTTVERLLDSIAHEKAPPIPPFK
jgi:hypothetical protein